MCSPKLLIHHLVLLTRARLRKAPVLGCNGHIVAMHACYYLVLKTLQQI